MALMILISTDSEKVNTDDVVSMIAMSDTESEAGNEKVNIPGLKVTLHLLLIKNLSAIVLSLINQIKKLSAVKEQLFNKFSIVKFEYHNLECCIFEL